MDLNLNTIANVIAVSAVLPLGLFIYFYGTKPAPGKWYKRTYSNRWASTAIGKVLMIQKIVWFAFLLFVLHSTFFDYLAEPYVRMIAYSALVVQFWVVFFVLRGVQKSPPPPEDNVDVDELQEDMAE